MNIPKELIDRFFECKYKFYQNRELYVLNRETLIGFEYYVFINRPIYYLDLISVYCEIKQYIKNIFSTIVTDTDIDKYYQLSINYAYNNNIEMYESPIFKTDSIIKLYEYLFFSEKMEEIKLFDAFMGMHDCSNISKISEYDNQLHTLIWNYDSYEFDNIDNISEYDNTLKKNLLSIIFRKSNNECVDVINLICKYPKSTNDKIKIKTFISNCNLQKQLEEIKDYETILINNIEHYDILKIIEKFFNNNILANKFGRYKQK